MRLASSFALRSGWSLGLIVFAISLNSEFTVSSAFASDWLPMHPTFSPCLRVGLAFCFLISSSSRRSIVVDPIPTCLAALTGCFFFVCRDAFFFPYFFPLVDRVVIWRAVSSIASLCIRSTLLATSSSSC